VSTNRSDRRLTKRPYLAAALSLLGAGWLCASASYASVKVEWTDGVSRDQTFSRVLVVGISPDRNQRCRFERAMASSIRSADTVAVVSCDVMPADAPLTRENIEAALAAENADAVFATSLISAAWETEKGGTRDTRGLANYKPTDSYYGIYGSVVAVDFRTTAPLTTVKGKAHVTSKLYETRGATVVYTMNTTIRDVQSTDEALAEVVGPVGNKLRKDGLIR